VSTPKPTTPSRPPVQDTSEQMPTLPVFTSTPVIPFSPSLTSFDFRTPTIKPSHGSCTLSTTIQSLASYTSLTIFSQFIYALGTALTRASTCSGHRPRRLGALSRDGLCIRGQPPPSRGGHHVQFDVRSPFVSRLLCDSHSSPPCVCALRPPRRLRPHYDGTAVHTPAVATRSLFHLTLLLFTGRRPHLAALA
jgi:hypothetical protein